MANRFKDINIVDVSNNNTWKWDKSVFVDVRSNRASYFDTNLDKVSDKLQNGVVKNAGELIELTDSTISLKPGKICKNSKMSAIFPDQHICVSFSYQGDSIVAPVNIDETYPVLLERYEDGILIDSYILNKTFGKRYCLFDAGIGEYVIITFYNTINIVDLNTDGFSNIDLNATQSYKLRYVLNSISDNRFNTSFTQSTDKYIVLKSTGQIL